MSDVRHAIAAVLLVTLPAVGQETPVLVGGHQDITSFGPGARIVAADFDDDGLPDVAFNTTDAVRVVRGLGDGRFEFDVMHLSPEIGLGSLTAFDFDLDGVLDLAAIAGSGFQVALGQGGLSFAPPVNYALDEFPGEFAIGDLDGDGWSDVVVSHHTGVRLEMLLGVGGGAFGAATDFGPTSESPARIALGDFDGDDDLDVAALSALEATVTVLLGDGAGGFADSQTLAAGDADESLGAGDLDGDGRDDLLCAGDEQLQVILADPAGGFEPPAVHPVPGDLLDIELVDLDEDGHLDVAIRTDTEVQALRGHGDGGLDAALGIPIGRNPRGWAMADFDVDGEIDFIATTFGLTVAFNRGDFVFGPAVHVGSDPEEVLLADFDGDGRLDVATADQEPTVSVCLGKGDGWLGARSTLALTHAGPAQLAAADFDGDGNTDLAAATAASSQTQLRTWSSLGDGSFAAPVDLAIGGSVRDLAAADLNGDLADDLMVVVSPSYDLVVFFNDRAGSFLPPESFPLGSGAVEVVTADFNADGDLDVASLHSNVEQLRIHLNDGAGGLLPATVVAGSTGIMGLSCGDADGDGHLDLLTSDHIFTAVALHYGHGDGTFEPAVVLSIAGARGSAAADIDEDGIPDVLVWRTASSTVPQIGLFRGLGGRAFGPLEEQESPTSVFDVAVGDMNQDGALDAVSVSYNASEARVLLNTLGPWDDLLKPLAGTAGLPHQTGVGTLVAGQHFSFTLSDARPSALCWHIVGVAALNANFKGGTMVPFPTLVNGPLLTNPQGQLVLAGNWPNGAPSGLPLYIQFWIKDIGGPAGFAASNALRATLP